MSTKAVARLGIHCSHCNHVVIAKVKLTIDLFWNGDWANRPEVISEKLLRAYFTVTPDIVDYKITKYYTDLPAVYIKGKRDTIYTSIISSKILYNFLKTYLKPTE